MANHKSYENHPKKLIRNSTAEFLIFTSQAGEQSIEAHYEDETIWLSQKLMAALFNVNVRTINEHLKNIYEQGEVVLEATIRKFRIVQKEGGREVARNVDFYNLDAIISVGYRVNSVRATQFRQWATQVLREFAIKGYVLDKKRMENGTFLGEDYFERLLEEIREIRLSERKFYQKITDIYATSVDYNKDAPTTKAFFAKVQNKLHFAIHGHTAAELIMQRADSSKDHMGLTSWEKTPNEKILKTDVFIAKNYLTKEELGSLSRIVNAYLELAEERALLKIHLKRFMTGKEISKDDARKILQEYLIQNVKDLVKTVEITERKPTDVIYTSCHNGSGWCVHIPNDRPGIIGASRTIFISKETGKVGFDGFAGE